MNCKWLIHGDGYQVKQNWHCIFKTILSESDNFTFVTQCIEIMCGKTDIFISRCDHLLPKVDKLLIIFFNGHNRELTHDLRMSNVDSNCLHLSIPAKPIHNRGIVSVHFNHFRCIGICDKLSRQLSMFTYIYLNVDKSGWTSSMP